MIFFAKFDRSSQIKNITDRLILGELQVDNISAKITTGNIKQHIPIR